MAAPATFPLARPALRLHEWGTRHPLFYYTLPLLAWAALIAVTSLIPSEDLPQFEFDLADKIEHGLCYAIFGLLLLRGWSRQTVPTLTACLVVEAVAGAWGLYLEFLQLFTGYRTFDWRDAVTNGVGALVGITLWFLAARWLVRQVQPKTPPVPAQTLGIHAPATQASSSQESEN